MTPSEVHEFPPKILPFLLSAIFRHLFNELLVATYQEISNFPLSQRCSKSRNIVHHCYQRNNGESLRVRMVMIPSRWFHQKQTLDSSDRLGWTAVVFTVA